MAQHRPLARIIRTLVFSLFALAVALGLMPRQAIAATTFYRDARDFSNIATLTINACNSHWWDSVTGWTFGCGGVGKPYLYADVPYVFVNRGYYTGPALSTVFPDTLPSGSYTVWIHFGAQDTNTVTVTTTTSVSKTISFVTGGNNPSAWYRIGELPVDSVTPMKIDVAKGSGLYSGIYLQGVYLTTGTETPSITPHTGNPANITLPSVSIDLSSERTINITVQNTQNASNTSWPADAKSIRVTQAQDGLSTTWSSTCPQHSIASTFLSDVYPLSIPLEPGEAVTFPIRAKSSASFLALNSVYTANGPCGSRSYSTQQPYLMIELIDGGSTVLQSVSVPLTFTSTAGLLSISPSAPTSLPEVPITLTATLTNIGSAWWGHPTGGCPQPGTLSVTLKDPRTGTSQAYTTNGNFRLSPGQSQTLPLTLSAPTVPGTYELSSWAFSLQFENQCNSPAASVGINGSPVSSNSKVALIVNPVPLTVAPLAQAGWNVISAITWPTSVTHSTESTNCGTKTTQTFTGASGTCQYTAPGTYKVTGSYIAKDGKLATTQPITIRVPSVAPNTGVMQLSVNGQSAPNDATTISRYRTPAALDMTIAFDRPSGIGVVDPIDLSTSILQLVRGGNVTATPKLSAGADPLHLAASQTLDTGETTLQLNAKTLSGTPVSFSRTLTLSQIPVVLTGSAPQQDGADLVATQVAFPDSHPITPTNIECGTTNPQVISAASVTCRYTKADTYSIVGSFMPNNETGTTPVLTQPLPFTVAGLPPVNVALGIGVGEVVLTTSPIQLYTTPASVLANVAMERDATQTGVLDPLNPDTLKLRLTPLGQSQTDLKAIQRTPLSFDALMTIPASGDYRLHLDAVTMLGVPVSADLPFSVTVTPVSLTLSPLRHDPEGVALDVTWPDTLAGNVQCGLKAKSFDGHTGVCTYSAPGTYVLKAAFRDPLTRAVVKLPDTTVTIPAVAPSGVAFRLTTLNNVLLPTQTPPPSVMTIPTPSAYPLNFVVTISPIAPDSTVGIVIPFDPSRSVVSAVPLAGGDPETARIRPVPDSKTMQAIGQIRTILPDPADASTWASRILLTAYTAAGDSFSSEILLKGPIGNGGTTSAIQLEVERNAPRILYAPATYRYRVKKAITPTLKEPLTTVWTLQDSDGNTIESATASRYMTTLPSAGTYTLTLRISGPFSGSQQWTDTILVPDLPPPGTPTLITKAPQYNRPPATYRFLIQTPKFADPRERAGIPTWSVDGGLPKSGLQALPTFTEPGEHTVSAQVVTSYNRVMTAETSVTINENQPPTAAVDCSKSRFSLKLKTYILVCQAAPKDPDGRVMRIKWIIPELNFERPDSTGIVIERPDPITATVELHVTDNSGAESVVSTLIDPNAFNPQ